MVNLVGVNEAGLTLFPPRSGLRTIYLGIAGPWLVDVAWWLGGPVFLVLVK